jgi:peptidoglycan hydrolase-like amidase
VTILHLDGIGNPIPKQNGQPWLCKANETAFGCVETNAYGKKYPYGNTNPVLLDVEKEYLLSVLPREMNVIENAPSLPALRAQVVAARTFADWKYRANNGYIDNSTNFQIYAPYSFIYYTRSNIDLSSPNDPCNENGGNNTLNGYQLSICNAVATTRGQYLALAGSAIDA